MKMNVLFYYVFIIFHISNQCNASLESFSPANVNILRADTTKYSDKSCYRPCKFNVKPKRCFYKFKIEPTIQDDGTPAIVINGMSPGPPIEVCVNDMIIVEVSNKIQAQDIAIHWHGIEQKGTPFMDGVPMVTQCPINYGSTYTYAFKATTPGTYFYHADSVSHHSDGVYGSLIVNQPAPMEPHSTLYDYDRSREHTLLIGAKFAVLMTGYLEDKNQLRPNSLVINGATDGSKLFVLPGYAYRLRIVNAVAIECPIVISIDDHDVVVISTDGKPVKGTIARNLQLFPGERMDFVVRASAPSGGYWVRVRGEGACEGLTTKAMLIYSGFNYTSMLFQKQSEFRHDNKMDADVINGQMLERLHDDPLESLDSSNVKSVYLSIDRNVADVKDSENDFRYISDAIPKKPFLPASLFLNKKGIVQINGKSLLYPNVPFLLKPHDVRPDMICNVEEESKHSEIQCVHILNANERDTLELILANEGFGSDESYTFHLHGYKMQVVATWQNPNNKPIYKNKFMQQYNEGKIVRNLQNAPLKDTITVPNKGFTIVRIRPDRGGSWMLECRSCGISSLPTAIIINIPQTLPKIVTDMLPKCGNYRPPDVLLN